MNSSSSEASQWTHIMRQEIMDSLRVELQNDLRSQYEQEFKIMLRQSQSEGEAKLSQLEEKVDSLQQRCDTLYHTNSMILQRQFDDEAKVARLEQDIKSLRKSFEKTKRKANYLEVVHKNQQWEYPHDIPTMDELSSLGFDHDDSECIIDQIIEMKEITTQMRMGKEINFMDPGENFMPNYDGYLPHYDEFAKALVEYQQIIRYMEDSTFHFSLGDTPLTRNVLDQLQYALKHTHFQKLTFSPNEIGGVGYINFIANCIKSDIRLKVLSFYTVDFESLRDIDVLCAAVNSSNTLQHMTLAHCQSEEGNLSEIFIKLKSKTLEKISLHRLNISNLRATGIHEFLASNPCLNSLKISSNQFNEQDILHISDALRQNTTLREIDLGCVHYLPNNWCLLKSVVFDFTSLNAVFNSNHYCHVGIFGYDSRPTDICKFNTCVDPNLNRRKKIYFILSMRNIAQENVACFESDGIRTQHIPQILSLLKPFSEHYLHDENGVQDPITQNPLSITYEIMRNWKMPELYNFELKSDCVMNC